MRSANLAVFWISHCQITSTFQPSFRSLLLFFLSRNTFSSNFFFQNWSLVFGVYARRQPLWRCQKQPWTNMTVEYFGRTISGLPGRFRAFLRNRNPALCRADLTRISGLVFVPLMRLMFQLRCSLEIVSAMETKYKDGRLTVCALSHDKTSSGKGSKGGNPAAPKAGTIHGESSNSGQCRCRGCRGKQKVGTWTRTAIAGLV